MDGYAITVTSEEAMACFGKEGVRHVAELDSGEGFVAFNGEIPCGGLIFEAESDWSGYDHVRHHGPQVGEEETFGLFTADVFRRRFREDVKMATLVGCGLVLAMTRGKLGGALWTASATRWLDVRVPEHAEALVNA